MTVAVIDYGLCNLDSVRRALEECGREVEVTRDAARLRAASHIVLPGVGALPSAMERMRSLHMDEALVAEAEAGASVLGICLGMQMLATSGTEAGGADGLGLVPGTVDRLVPTQSDRRVPHIGWNEVDPIPGHPLFADIPGGTDFYFVHSFHLRCDNDVDIAATTPYAGGFVSAVSHGSVHGVQFHPEKSQAHGFALLRNFLGL